MKKRVQLRNLPPQVRKLLIEFRNELPNILEHNLVGIYLFGSIAFPGYEPQSGDIDFYVVVKQALKEREKNELDDLHRGLARKFRFGNLLDGFYISLAKARRRTSPTGLLYAANGRLHVGGSDTDWSLHREHFHRGASIVLHGKEPRRVFPRASWRQIERALDGNLAYAKRLLPRYPFWAVMQLCRLICSFETGVVDISKVEAAGWGLEELPSVWRPLIRSAVRVYLGEKKERDRKMLKEKAPAFFTFASQRIAKTKRLS